MTTEQEKLRRYDTRQKGLELKKRLATIDAELRDYAAAWSKLSEMFDRDISKTFTVDDALNVIRVSRPDQSKKSLPGRSAAVNILAEVGRGYFDSDRLESLLADLENTKKEWADISKLCEAMGDPISSYS
jgi:hypothetical protein